MMDDIHIRCPRCQWEPDGRPHWRCTCGITWDTFATCGRCPGCGKVWEHTQCISRAGGCGGWSPHLDWYEGLGGIVEKLKEEILQDWRAPALAS